MCDRSSVSKNKNAVQQQQKPEEVHLQKVLSCTPLPWKKTQNKLPANVAAVMWECVACEKWGRMNNGVEAISHN